MSSRPSTRRSGTKRTRAATSTRRTQKPRATAAKKLDAQRRDRRRDSATQCRRRAKAYVGELQSLATMLGGLAETLGNHGADLLEARLQLVARLRVMQRVHAVRLRSGTDGSAAVFQRIPATLDTVTPQLGLDMSAHAVGVAPPPPPPPVVPSVTAQPCAQTPASSPMCRDIVDTTPTTTAPPVPVQVVTPKPSLSIPEPTNNNQQESCGWQAVETVSPSDDLLAILCDDAEPGAVVSPHATGFAPDGFAGTPRCTAPETVGTATKMPLHANNFDQLLCDSPSTLWTLGGSPNGRPYKCARVANNDAVTCGKPLRALQPTVADAACANDTPTTPGVVVAPQNDESMAGDVNSPSFWEGLSILQSQAGFVQ